MPEFRGEWEGRISIVAEDDFLTRTSRTRSWLDVNGERVEIDAANLPTRLRPGMTVRVRGVRQGSRIAASAIEARGPAPAGSGCDSPVGEQKVAVILLEFPGYPLSTTGLTAADFRDIFFSTTKPSLDGYVREASFGKAAVSGDVFGPIKLDKYYVYAQQKWEGFDAAIRAADPIVDYRTYNRLVLVWPGGSGFSASGSVACASITSPTKGTLPISETILSIGSPFTQEVTLSFSIHEFGHNLGLNHASTRDFAPLVLGIPGAPGIHVEYGDPFSQMGDSRTHTVPQKWLFGHFAAPHKFELGWLTKPGDLLDVQTSGSFHLLPAESGTAGLKAVRVRRGPQSDKWLWVEYRQPLGFDQTLNRVSTQVFTGALVHYEDPLFQDSADPLSPQRTYLLDYTAAGTPHDFTDAALSAGQTWTDLFDPVSLRVDSADSSGLGLTVTYGTPCVTLGSTGRTHGTGNESGTIAVSAAPGCIWSAASAVDWITITAGQTGNGAGTVSYAVSANRWAESRTGMITVGWTVFTITQASSSSNEPPSAVSLAPDSGSGFSSTFTIGFTDVNGASDLRTVYAYFRSRSDSRECRVFISPATRDISLMGDDGRSWLGPVRPAASEAGSVGTLQNSLCGVDAAGLSVTLSGNNVTVTLPMVFTRNFSGDLDIGGGASDAAETRIELTGLAKWTVPQTTCAYSFDRASFELEAAASTGSVAVQTQSGCPWMATSNASWITVTSSSTGAGPATVNFFAAANTGTAPRIGTLVVGGQSVVVIQAGAVGTKPVIAENGVVNGGSFQPGIASSAWITIRGARLAASARTWSDADFTGARLPTQLDGVSVNVNGKPAYIYYISPTQINALSPDDNTEGPVSVEVGTPQGKTDAVWADKQKYSPSLFLFDVEARRYVAAVHVDGAYVGKASLFPGLTTRPAKPGDVILLYGTGFGSTSPTLPAGEVVKQPANLAAPVVVRIGNVQAEVLYAGLVSSGLCQFNVKVPDAADGDQPVIVEIGGFRSQYNAYLTVQR